jgi:hypothetical protein
MLQSRKGRVPSTYHDVSDGDKSPDRLTASSQLDAVEVGLMLLVDLHLRSTICFGLKDAWSLGSGQFELHV